VFERREPASFTGLGENFLYLAFFVSELEMASGEDDYDPSGVLVHRRFLVRAVVHGDNLDAVIFEIQFVMLGFNFGGILSPSCLHRQA
jgi:hypothetical protein